MEDFGLWVLNKSDILKRVEASLEVVRMCNFLWKVWFDKHQVMRVINLGRMECNAWTGLTFEGLAETQMCVSYNM